MILAALKSRETFCQQGFETIKKRKTEKFNKKLFVIEGRRKKYIIAVAPGKSEKSFKVLLLPGKLRNKAFSIV